MSPLFALEPFTTAPAERAPRSRVDSPAGIAADSPYLVPYQISGIFRLSSGEDTRTVQGYGLNTRLEADIATFLAYLQESGWLFDDGRGLFVRLVRIHRESSVSSLHATGSQ